MSEAVDGYTLLFDVWVVANSTRALLDRALRPSGLSAEEFALYSAIRRDGGITPTDLASLLALPPTTVSSVVARLERRGHVRRDRHPGDGRSYRLRLTAAGQAAHAAAGALFAPVLGRVEAVLSLPPGQARAVLAAIDTAVRAATSVPGSAPSAPGPATSAPGPATSAPGPATSAPGSVTSAPGPAPSAPGPAPSAPGLTRPRR
jgi:DNA-binding MarR family transcriptional regulator